MASEHNTRRWGLFGRAMVLFAAWLVLIAAWHVVSAPAANAAPLQYGCRQTSSGPLCPSDVDLVVRVRQAGLWEEPSGEMAQTQAASPRVKEVGAAIAADHHFLDNATNEIAAQLGITLPDQPTTAQQGWLAQERPAIGAAFDQTFTNLLRASHGAIFSTIAQVRAGTRNDLIRSYAEVANTYVLKHMKLLESTGLVAYQALPAAPAPGAVAGSGLAPGAPPGPGFVWAMLVAGVLLTLIAVVMMYRFGRPRRRQATW